MHHVILAGCLISKLGLNIEFWSLVSDTSVTRSKILWTTKKLSETTKNFNILPPNAKVGNSKNNNNNNILHNNQYSLYGTIHKRRLQFFWFFDTPSPISAVFCTIQQQFWPIFVPFPPSNCRHHLWTDPMYNIHYQFWYLTTCQNVMMHTKGAWIFEFNFIKFLAPWCDSSRCDAGRSLHCPVDEFR